MTRTYSPVGRPHWRIVLACEAATGDYSFTATNLRTGKSLKSYLWPSMWFAREGANQYVEAQEGEAP